MKLRENICFEVINQILYYWGFGNNLKVNINDIFLKNYVLKKAKILMFLLSSIYIRRKYWIRENFMIFGKEIK